MLSSENIGILYQNGKIPYLSVLCRYHTHTHSHVRTVLLETMNDTFYVLYVTLNAS